MAIVGVVLIFALATTVVRGGNDAYESFSRGELAAVNYVYDHIRPGQSIGSANYYLPIGQRDIGTISVFSPESPSNYQGIGVRILRNRPTYVILSQSEDAYGEVVAGYPVGWEAKLETSLVNHGYSIVAQWTTATVLKVSK